MPLMKLKGSSAENSNSRSFWEGASLQAAEKLEFRIRVSLQRYHKSIKINSPFRGGACLNNLL